MRNWSQWINEHILQPLIDASPGDRPMMLLRWAVIGAAVLVLCWLVPRLLGL